MTESITDSGKSPVQARHWLTAKRMFAGLSLFAALVGAWLVRSVSGMSFAWSYLISLNAVTLVLYGYDRTVAGIGWLRVPEAVLHTVTIAGGTPAAFIGQNLFHHKTAKGGFRRTFWLIVVVQLVVFALWIYLTRK